MEVKHNGDSNKQINVFSLMMANRHKQDDIIKDLEKLKDDTACQDDYNSDTEVTCISTVKLITNSNEKSVTTTSHMKNYSSKVNNLSDNTAKPKNLNAFQYLMCKSDRFKDIFSDDDSDINSTPDVKGKLSLKANNKHPIIVSSDDSCDSQTARDLNFNSSHQSLHKLNKINPDSESNLNSKKELLEPQCDLKLNLIDENEYFNIEETFKEEILECVSKKKKKKRKVKMKNNNCSKIPDTGASLIVPVKENKQENELKSKSLNCGSENINNDIIMEKENITSKFDETPNINIPLPQKCSIIPQPNITSFFKTIQNEDKLSSKETILDKKAESEENIATNNNHVHVEKESKLLCEKSLNSQNDDKVKTISKTSKCRIKALRSIRKQGREDNHIFQSGDISKTESKSAGLKADSSLVLDQNKCKDNIQTNSISTNKTKSQSDLKIDYFTMNKNQALDEVQEEQANNYPVKPNFLNFFTLIPKHKKTETKDSGDNSPSDLKLEGKSPETVLLKNSYPLKQKYDKNFKKNSSEINNTNQGEKIACSNTSFKKIKSEKHNHSSTDVKHEVSDVKNKLSSEKLSQNKKALKKNKSQNDVLNTQIIKTDILKFCSQSSGKHSKENNSKYEIDLELEDFHEKSVTNKVNGFLSIYESFLATGGVFTEKSKKNKVIDINHTKKKALIKTRGLELNTNPSQEIPSQAKHSTNSVKHKHDCNMSDIADEKIDRNISGENSKKTHSYRKTELHTAAQDIKRNNFSYLANKEITAEKINYLGNTDTDLDNSTSMHEKAALITDNSVLQEIPIIINEKPKKKDLTFTNKEDTDKISTKKNYSVSNKKYFGIFTDHMKKGQQNTSAIDSDSDWETVDEASFSKGNKCDENLSVNHDSSSENKLRRSSRTIKKIKPFEILAETHKKRKEKVSSLKNISTNNSDSELMNASTEKATPQNRRKHCDKDGSKLKNLSLKHRKQSLRSKDENKVSVFTVQKSPCSLPCLDICNSDDDSVIEVISLRGSPENTAEKIAPIFVKKKPVVISPTKLKAHTDFLFSDVPEVLKKLAVKSDEQKFFCPFPKQSHVRQNSDSDSYWNLPDSQVPLLRCKAPEEFITFPQEPFCGLTDRVSSKQTRHLSDRLQQFPPLNSSTVCHILAYLKAVNKDFPTLAVYAAYIASKEDYLNAYKQECAKEAFRKEREKCGKVKSVVTIDEGCVSPLLLKGRRKRKKKLKSSRSLKRRRIAEVEIEDTPETDEEEVPIWDKWIPYDWTQVFAPRSSDFVIGNEDCIRNVKDILNDWKVVSKVDSSSSRRDASDSSSSEADENGLNSILITGPPGIGKTSFVYALAQDFSYKVLEVNASSSRQGKQLLSQLSEATQSHTLSSNSSQILSALESSQVENSDQSEKAKSMSLILIEDIDIVFEEADEGFWSAVNALLSTSKRPIIMTSSLATASFAKKIKGNYKRIDFVLPDPFKIAQHLQLMCLANGIFASFKEVELLVRCNKQDIRKSISDLQMWALSGACDVQWWKLNNSENMKNALKPDDKNVRIETLFPSASRISSKSVELPISRGCLWTKSDAKFLLEQCSQLELDPPLNWILLSSNSTSLLPFVKRQQKRDLKYPLKRDDPDLKKASVWLKYLWLDIGNEDDIEEQTPTPDDKHEDTKPTPSSEMKQACHTCLNSLSRYYNSIADFDILSSGSMPLESKESCEEFRNKFWTPSTCPGLESVSTKSSFHSYSSNLSSEFIPELSKRMLKCSQDDFFKLASSVDGECSPLTVDVMRDMPPQNMKPHSLRSQREILQCEDLNLTLSSIVPLSSQVNRSSLVNDYLPYLREFARFDHLEESVRKHFKRSKRHLKYLRQIGLPPDVSPRKLIDICNVFYGL